MIFQTMKAVIWNNLSLKYHICTPSNCKDKGIRKFAFVAKTQFLLTNFSTRAGALISSDPPCKGGNAIQNSSLKSFVWSNMN